MLVDHDEVDVVTAGHTVIGDREQTIGIGREIYADNVAAHRHHSVDETRPLLQGSRLTAYEARRAGIPYQVLADSAAASLMAAGEVDLVAVGADRIAADGSVANKVGTYPLALAAREVKKATVPLASIAVTAARTLK